MIVPLLVRESAHTIFIPAHASGWSKEYIDYLRRLKGPLGRRVKLIDYNGAIALKTKRYLQPVEDWVLSDIKHPRPTIGINHPRECEVYFGLNEVAYFLYLLNIGIHEQAEISVNIPKTVRKLRYFATQVTDLEGRLRIEQLAGLANLYEKSSICAFGYEPKLADFSMLDRIEDLLDEAEIVEISRKRYSLGMPRIDTSLQLAWLKSKLWYRKIMRKRKYKKFLRLSKEIINYIPKLLGKEIPGLEIPFFDKESYRPPCVDVNAFLVTKLQKQFRKPLVVRNYRGTINWVEEDN